MLLGRRKSSKTTAAAQVPPPPSQAPPPPSNALESKQQQEQQMPSGESKADADKRERWLMERRMLELHGYELLDKVGEGAYGVVHSARDTRTGQLVAIKKISGALDRVNSCKRTFRELKFLSLMQHENIIQLQHILSPAEAQRRAGIGQSDVSKLETTSVEKPFCTDLFAVFNLMETDLTCIIKSSQALTNEHCQFFVYQVLRGLKFVHSANIIHRDLKPRNLLVNSNCDLRICDFGLARLDLPELARSDGACMSDYVATRWYRPPEVVLQSGTYTKALDMWAVGCILAELLLRKPIFPGADQYDLLRRICEVLGPPPPGAARQARTHKLQVFMRNLGYQYPAAVRPLSHLLRHCDPQAVDLVSRLLVWEPERRLTVEQALQHPYLAQLYCPRDEPARSPIEHPDFAFERERSPCVAHLRGLLMKQLRKYERAVQGSSSSIGEEEESKEEEGDLSSGGSLQDVDDLARAMTTQALGGSDAKKEQEINKASPKSRKSPLQQAALHIPRSIR